MNNYRNHLRYELSDYLETARHLEGQKNQSEGKWLRAIDRRKACELRLQQALQAERRCESDFREFHRKHTNICQVVGEIQDEYYHFAEDQEDEH